MEVNFIGASDKLKSALEKIENHPGGMDSYYIDYMNLVDIQKENEWNKIFDFEWNINPKQCYRKTSKKI